MTNYKLKVGAHQKGFTLIEMSIVLVIIGLIIGGILKGQELIESSRQKNFISQADSYRASLTTFSERYNALPGDFNCADTGAGNACAGVGRMVNADAGNIANGGGNGIIGTLQATTAGMDTGPATTDAASTEELQFWIHMNAANLVGGVSPINVTPTGFGGNNALPAAPFPNSGLSLVYGFYNTSTTSPKQTHWLLLHRTAGAANPTAALSPKQMFNLDSKIDDGMPGAGSFRTANLNQGAAAGCGTVAGTNSDYIPTIETILCMAYIELVQ